MLLLRNIPIGTSIKFLGFYHDCVSVKFHDSHQMTLLFDKNSEQKDVRIVNQEYNSAKKILFERMYKNAINIKANALIEFQFEHQKVDSKTLWLIVSGSYVQVQTEKIDYEIHSFLFDDNSKREDNRSEEREKIVVSHSDIPRTVVQDNEIRRVNNQYMDIGGSHQMKMMARISPNDIPPMGNHSEVLPTDDKYSIVQGESIGDSFVKRETTDQVLPKGDGVAVSNILAVPLLTDHETANRPPVIAKSEFEPDRSLNITEGDNPTNNDIQSSDIMSNVRSLLQKRNE